MKRNLTTSSALSQWLMISLMFPPSITVWSFSIFSQRKGEIQLWKEGAKRTKEQLKKEQKELSFPSLSSPSPSIAFEPFLSFPFSFPFLFLFFLLVSFSFFLVLSYFFPHSSSSSFNRPFKLLVEPFSSVSQVQCQVCEVLSLLLLLLASNLLLSFLSLTFFLTPDPTASLSPDVREGVLVIGSTVQLLLILFQLDRWADVAWSWYQVFLPTWVTCALLLYLNIIIAIRLQNTRHGTPAKLIVLETIPTVILLFFFMFLLARRLQTPIDDPTAKVDTFAVVFTPMFIWASLAVLSSLMKFRSWKDICFLRKGACTNRNWWRNGKVFCLVCPPLWLFWHHSPQELHNGEGYLLRLTWLFVHILVYGVVLLPCLSSL